MTNSLSKKLQLAFTFTFEHDGHIIEANASSLTGKEIITVDGIEVSNKRSLGFKSSHTFSVGDKDYTLRFNVNGFILCQVECELFCGDQRVGAETHSSVRSKKVFFRNILIFFVIGIIFGFLSAKAAIWFMG